MFHFVFLALTLFGLFPCLGAELPHPMPAPPEPDFGLLAGPAGAGLAPALAEHAQTIAHQSARFNQTLAATLDRAPRPVATAPAAPGPALASVASLNARLETFRQWLVRERAAAGPASAPFPLALKAQLAAVENLSAGMQLVTTGYLARILEPAEAIGLIRLASDTLLNIVNSFRVIAQTQALETFPPSFGRLATQLNETRSRIQADQAGADRAAAIPLSSAPPGGPPAPGARTGQACCDYLELQDQVAIHRVIGAAGSTNAAAYLVATEAATAIVVRDALAAGNSTLLGQLLADADAGALAAAALAATVLDPPPAAAPDPDAGLPAPCAAFRCRNPITRIQATVAAETLAGSIMNLVGYALYSTSVQLTLAMEVESGRAPAPPAARGDRSGWLPGLMRQLRSQALAAVPGEGIAALLDTVPGAPAGAAAAFAGIAPGLGGAQTFQAVMEVTARAVQTEYLPALAGITPDSARPADALGAILSGLHQLAAAGQERGGLATGGAPAQWQYHAQFAACCKYALAASNGCRAGIIDSATAATLLKDIADTLQALIYGLLAEASGVPAGASLRYLQAVPPELARARARILGQDPPATLQDRTCQDCCHALDLQSQETALEISQDATRTSLAAYLEALAGSAITEALDLAGLVGRPAQAQNRTRMAIQSASPAAGASQAGTSPSAPSPAASPGAAAAAAPDPAPRSPSGCACACDLASSGTQVTIAADLRSGAELTQFAYTLNLVVKALRIALLAGSR